MSSGLFIVYAIFVVIGSIGAVAFPIVLTWKTAWWRSAIGVDAFFFSTLFALLYLRGLIGLFNPVSQKALAEQDNFTIVFAMVITIAAGFGVWFRLWTYFATLSTSKGRRQEK